ncbi:35855_t:CDS:2, partial [Gigaspora margarita]
AKDKICKHHGTIVKKIIDKLFEVFHDKLNKTDSSASADTIKTFKEFQNTKWCLRKLNIPINTMSSQTCMDSIISKVWVKDQPTEYDKVFAIAICLYILDPKYEGMKLEPEKVNSLYRSLKASGDVHSNEEINVQSNESSPKKNILEKLRKLFRLNHIQFPKEQFNEASSHPGPPSSDVSIYCGYKKLMHVICVRNKAPYSKGYNGLSRKMVKSNDSKALNPRSRRISRMDFVTIPKNTIIIPGRTIPTTGCTGPGLTNYTIKILIR